MPLPAGVDGRVALRRLVGGLGNNASKVSHSLVDTIRHKPSVTQQQAGHSAETNVKGFHLVLPVMQVEGNTDCDHLCKLGTEFNITNTPASFVTVQQQVEFEMEKQQRSVETKKTCAKLMTLI